MTLPTRNELRQPGSMTVTQLSPRSADGMREAVVRPDRNGTVEIVPVTRGRGDRTRTIGVVLVDADGARWQRTVDLERLVTVGTVTAGLLAATGVVASALRRSGAHVDRITMGPGGWVSFKGGRKPQPHGPRRPWWAVLLQARPVDG